jgi:hypothetical protein
MEANTGLRGSGSLLSAVVRICAVISTEAGLGLGLGWVAAPPLHGGLDAVAGGPATAPGRTLEVLVVSVAGCLAWLALGLLVASTAATVLLATVHTLTAPAPPLRRLCGPMWWRRAVLGASGDRRSPGRRPGRALSRQLRRRVGAEVAAVRPGVSRPARRGPDAGGRWDADGETWGLTLADRPGHAPPRRPGLRRMPRGRRPLRGQSQGRRPRS